MDRKKVNEDLQEDIKTRFIIVRERRQSIVPIHSNTHKLIWEEYRNGSTRKEKVGSYRLSPKGISFVDNKTS